MAETSGIGPKQGASIPPQQPATGDKKSDKAGEAPGTEGTKAFAKDLKEIAEAMRKPKKDGELGMA